jgi:hypothetical protein
MRKLPLLLLAGTLFASAYAQRMPNKQEGALKISKKIKIDGMPLEVGGQFKAFNNATGLFYTIANNDRLLYIVLQANEPEIINKIALTGVKFTVKSVDDKNARVSLTYPAQSKEMHVYFNLIARKSQKPDTSGKSVDSIMAANNKKATENFKRIRVEGLANADTISIYNDLGIEAFGKFDRKKAFTVEMALPLEILRNEINQANTFAYELTVNGAPPIYVGPAVATTGSTDPAATARAEAEFQKAVEIVNAKRTAPTNVSGEYTLAK